VNVSPDGPRVAIIPTTASPTITESLVAEGVVFEVELATISVIPAEIVEKSAPRSTMTTSVKLPEDEAVAWTVRVVVLIACAAKAARNPPVPFTCHVAPEAE
jgi:hypothetical protein